MVFTLNFNFVSSSNNVKSFFSLKSHVANFFFLVSASLGAMSAQAMEADFQEKKFVSCQKTGKSLPNASLFMKMARLGGLADLGKDHFTSLPDELCLKIFGYLSLKERCQAACTSKKFQRLSKDTDFWKEFEALRIKLQTVNDFAKATEIFKQISGIEPEGSFADQLLDQNPYLRSVLEKHLFSSQKMRKEALNKGSLSAALSFLGINFYWKRKNYLQSLTPENLRKCYEGETSFSNMEQKKRDYWKTLTQEEQLKIKEIIQRAASKGNAQALCYMAESLISEDFGFDKNPQQAWKILKTQALNGRKEAINILQKWYASGLKDFPDELFILQNLIKKAASEGNEKAIWVLVEGTRWEEKYFGLKDDSSAAHTLIKKRILKGDVGTKRYKFEGMKWGDFGYEVDQQGSTAFFAEALQKGEAWAWEKHLNSLCHGEEPICTDTCLVKEGEYYEKRCAHPRDYSALKDALVECITKNSVPLQKISLAFYGLKKGDPQAFRDLIIPLIKKRFMESDPEALAWFIKQTIEVPTKDLLASNDPEAPLKGRLPFLSSFIKENLLKHSDETFCDLGKFIWVKCAQHQMEGFKLNSDEEKAKHGATAAETPWIQL